MYDQRLAPSMVTSQAATNGRSGPSTERLPRRRRTDAGTLYKKMLVTAHPEHCEHNIRTDRQCERDNDVTDKFVL
ncbi:unnamed protein product [Diatraea saccharalis]|uniref:Uncharacterized protein n=1 Tax=Diatraea saccharalis TaxID=40085 RepID=A0A9P0C9Q9_9NEOP|nr:unnamed protein product [Diatraea saccharalis]